MGDFDDMIPEFVAESTELLETVESGLLNLESGEITEDTIHTIFRAIHSIKGGAGFVGLSKIENLAHKMEDILNLIRNGDLVADQPITDSLLQALDVLNYLFEHVEGEEDVDVQAPIRALDAALNSGVSQDVKESMGKKGTPSAEAGLPPFDISAYTLEKKLSQGNVYNVRLNMSQIEDRGLTPLQLVNEMLSMGEILDSHLDLPEGEKEIQPRFDILYFTVLETDLLEAALMIDASDIRAINMADFGMEETPEPAVAKPEPEPILQEPAPVTQAAAPMQEVFVEPEILSPQSGAGVGRQPEQNSALVLAEEAEPASEAQVKGGEYLTFTLGKETYGVDILTVQEIIGMPNVSRLPNSPQYVLGVMNLRGMVAPVLDLRLKLALEANEDNEPVVMVVKVGARTLGVVVDGVEDVVEFNEESVQETPNFTGPIQKEHIKGLSRHEGVMVILLDLELLLGMDG
ncbi:chemotaxis protein CheW [Dethiosulfatarculus sandiegensis]|uniref:Chemotaxis protein CheW n=1 Tax=Dethiosulfatarculus sandiegensis TaxID=1429043 RepID=A0A0D2GF94_9BACT|nr:chemotaxis protein CheW [Dethiosulfatarculus sandiegensis]KIX13587.1 chemotaxis protein [Dethiosulfatarculus sandiegensis]